jgi:phosphoribosylformylglycinamidine cyclo-ligase
VSGTDGVGTKLKVAFATGEHGTIGQDLVAMCVNDIVTTGARPLFFLDYFATGKLTLEVAEAVIKGIANACKESGCALLGGETAELPGMYADGEYDLAGFAVGVVGRSKLVDGKSVAAGDVVIGLPSSGIHSNGYSLARKVLLEKAALGFDAKPAELGGKTLGEALLVPTRLYAKSVMAVVGAGVKVHAMSHITGGGLPGNLPRVLPDGLGVKIDTMWARSPLFDLIAKLGPVDATEMRRTFNDGVGFVFVVPAAEKDAALAALASAGEAPFVMGSVVAVPADTEFEARVLYPAAK